MGTALAPRRNDIRRHRTRDALGAVTVGLTSSDQHHALAIHSGASRRDFSHRVNFSRGRADRGRRARTSPDDSRVGGSMGHASPMSKGQHILIFLYPPSRLGLTSPVGGSLGQVALDSSGNSVAPSAQESAISSRPDSSLDPRAREAVANVSVMQLERAIRGARNEQ